MENEKDMSEKKSEAEIVISATPSEATASEKKSSGGLAKFAGFILLVLIIIGGGLAANGQLMPLLESLQTKFTNQQSSESEVVTSEPENAAVYQPAPQPEPEVAAESINVAASVEAEALLSTIEQLRSELQSMEASQRSLQHGLIEQQKMNLQVRLRWITDPASRAPQIQLAWEETSLLPGLSSEQRSSAEAMQSLARTTVQSLRDWQA